MKKRTKEEEFQPIDIDREIKALDQVLQQNREKLRQRHLVAKWVLISLFVFGVIMPFIFLSDDFSIIVSVAGLAFIFGIIIGAGTGQKDGEIIQEVDSIRIEQHYLLLLKDLLSKYNKK